jgi:hypothetical protein
MARRHGSISGHAGCVPVEFDSDLFLIKVGPLERDYLGASAPERFLRTEHRSEAEDSVLVRLSATRHEDLDRSPSSLTPPGSTSLHQRSFETRAARGGRPSAALLDELIRLELDR